jgi:hypothetical protein
MNEEEKDVERFVGSYQCNSDLIGDVAQPSALPAPVPSPVPTASNSPTPMDNNSSKEE